MNINAKIATLILRAQNASDGGKYEYHHRIKYLVGGSKRSQRDNCANYDQKDTLILDTIRLICSKKSDFKFAVTDSDIDQCTAIVYFQTRINGEKYQVSFHTKMDMERYKRSSFRIKWDHGVSRDNAVTIYEHYVPNGQYLGGGDNI